MLEDISDLTEQISEELSGDPAVDNDEKIRLGIGEYAVVEEEKTLTCHGLGSCIGIFLYDPTSGVGAGVHALLPRKAEGNEENKELTRYTDHAIETVYDELTARNDVNDDSVTAKIAGGSEMLQIVTFTSNVGQRNVESARHTLSKYGVDIVGEDTGGDQGRIVEFHTDTGGMVVRKADGDQKVI